MTICCQLLDESPPRGLVLRCALEAGHEGHHQSRGWRSPKRRRSARPVLRGRQTLTEEETRDRLRSLMQGDDG